MVNSADSYCPVTRSAKIIGSRWTAQILRDLLLNGSSRFQELQTSLEGIAPNTLSDRLKMLEAESIVERRFYEDHPPRAEYVLTDRGLALGAIIRAMRDWGTKYPD
jgi:DNA-binding HxlR family transcriptional regulator